MHQHNEPRNSRAASSSRNTLHVNLRTRARRFNIATVFQCRASPIHSMPPCLTLSSYPTVIQVPPLRSYSGQTQCWRLDTRRSKVCGLYSTLTPNRILPILNVLVGSKLSQLLLGHRAVPWNTHGSDKERGTLTSLIRGRYHRLRGGRTAGTTSVPRC